MLTIDSIMSSEVASCAPDASIAEVVAEMRRRNISCLAVRDGERPAGVISERDLAWVLEGLLEGRDPPKAARDVMSSPAVVIESGSGIPAAMALLEAHRIRRLIVVDDAGAMVGLITQTDLLESHARAVEAARDSLEAIVASRTNELERANEKLEELALTDGLLGIGNRRAMETEIERQQGLADRYGRAFSAAIVDVDFFKSYNDTYGHPEGDVVLQRITRTLARVIRASDSLFRYGGEELLLLMPETRLDGALHAGERVRLAVESLAIPHRYSPLGIVTVSVGVAEHRSERGGGAAADAVARADRGLYLAKSEGRNRTCTEPAESRPAVGAV